MMKYKGYIGSASLDTEAGVFRGRVTNTLDMITYQGRSVEELRREFEESVDIYLELCAERGEAPEKPFSGHFFVRIKPKLHRAAAAEASRRGVSLNAVVSRELAKFVKKSTSTSSPASDAEAPPKPRKPKTKPAPKSKIRGKAS